MFVMFQYCDSRTEGTKIVVCYRDKALKSTERERERERKN